MSWPPSGQSFPRQRPPARNSSGSSATKGTRPALVLSPAAYNAKTRMMVCCPITNQVKNYPFEVVIHDNPNVTGAILSDQLKNLDWRARKARHKGRVSDDELAETLGKIRALLGMH